MIKKQIIVLLAIAFSLPLFAHILMFENFDTTTVPNLPAGWQVRDYNSDGKTWQTSTSHPYSSPNCIRYNYSRTNAANDWFFTKGLNLTANIPYTVGFFYRGSSPSFPERLRIWVCSSQDSSGKIGSAIYDNSNIINTIYKSDLADFSVVSSGTYYLGFECYSPANMWNLRIDDISVYVDVHDVGVDTIFSPLPGTYPVNTVFRPKFLVRNYGQNTGGEEVPVHCLFVRYPPSSPPETLYHVIETVRVEICTPETVYCDTWIPQLPCNHKFIAYTALTDDQVPANDKKEVSFIVDFRDVRPISITIPATTMKWCTESIPTAIVRNEGHQTESFWVWFKSLDSLSQLEYLDSVYVNSLGAGQDTTLMFKKWHFPVCAHTAVVWTNLLQDENRANDTIKKPYTVYLIDAEVVSISAPDTVTACTPFMASALIHNNGQHFVLEPGWWVHAKIYDSLNVIVIHESAYVQVRLGYCDTLRVWFEGLHIPMPCRHRIDIYTAYPGDQVPANDLKSKTIYAQRIDAEITEIIAPDTVQVCNFFDVTVKVHNAGEHNILTAGWWVYLSIGTGYDSLPVLVPLAPCETASVTFSKHIAEPCEHIIHAWINYPGDGNPSNDSMFKQIVAKWFDVQIVPPINNLKDTVDLCTTIYPKIVIHNNGVHVPTQSGWVVYSVLRSKDGENYYPIFTDSVWKTLAHCVYDTVTFDYHPDSACYHRVTATVKFDPDQNLTNNTVSKDFVVRLFDFEGVAVVDMPDTAQVCNLYRPGIVVHNSGVHTGPRTATVFMQIFRNGQLISDFQGSTRLLAPCEYDTIRFEWHADLACNHLIKAWVSFAEDQVPGNDTVWKSFVVKYYDFGVYAILDVPDTISFCTTLNPKVVIHNNGVHTYPQSGWVYLRDYRNHVLMWQDSVQVMSSVPCQWDTISFPNYHPDTCDHLLTASISFIPDQDPSNDMISKSYTVKYTDFSITGIYNIPDTIQLCTTLNPLIVIRNNGVHTTPESCQVNWVWYRGTQNMGSGSAMIRNSVPGKIDTVEFSYHPDSSCDWYLKAYLSCPNDANHENDTAYRYFVVKYYDIGAISIIDVPDTVQFCTDIYPKVVIHNNGVHTYPQSGWVYLNNYRNQVLVWQDSAFVTGSVPCRWDTITFQYHPDTCNHQLVAIAKFSPDQNPANDTNKKSYTVKYYDVGCYAILNIPDTVDFCNTINAQVVIHNNGVHTYPQSGWVYINYYRKGMPETLVKQDSQPWTATPCNWDTLTFSWHPDSACEHMAKAWVRFTPDQNPTNDTAPLRDFVVRLYDFEVVAVRGIPDTAQVCNDYYPWVIVHNNGKHTGPQNAQITLQIYRNDNLIFSEQGDIYNLEPCHLDSFQFEWHADSGCNHKVIAKVIAPIDQNHSNDSLITEFVVKYYDAEAVAVINVPDTVDVNQTMNPKVVVHNNSLHVPPQTGWVHLDIYLTGNPTPVFKDSVQRTLSYCLYDTVPFQWTPLVTDTCHHYAKGYVRFPDDQNPLNDTAPIENFVVRYRDVELVAITVPADTCHSCSTYIPAVTVKNNSSHSGAVVCTLNLKIWRYKIKMDSLCHITMDTTQRIMVYDSTVIVTVPLGTSTVYFPAWHPIWSDVRTGYGYWTYHSIKCTLAMAGDMDPNNNLFDDKTVVKARKYDLQMNYVGLLRGIEVLQSDTISVGISYNPVSVVSNSPEGPTLTFRAWYKIIRLKTNTVIYSRYLDRTLQAGQYVCLYFQSGWVPSDTGWYRMISYIETRAGQDSIAENNSLSRDFVAVTLPIKDAKSNEATQGAETSLPKSFALHQNYPNPVIGKTMIKFEIPFTSKVMINIYDATGRMIKTLANTTYEAGYYRTIWDGTDDRGKKVCSGVYFYDMQTDKYTARRKMVITQ